MITFNCSFENEMIGANAFKRFAPLPEDFQPIGGVEHRWTIDKKISRNGKQSLRIEVRPGDVGGNGNERAELRGMLDSRGNDVLENQVNVTKFIGFSVRLDPKWKAPSPTKKGEEGHSTIIQLHQIAEETKFDDVGPAIAINCIDRFFIKINARELNEPELKVNTFEFSNDGKKLLLGKWIDFVLEIRFSINKTGYVKVWRSNESESVYKLVFSKTGITTLHWDKKSKPVHPLVHTWHVGIYRSPQYKTKNPTTNILWLDNIIRADSIAEILSTFNKR